MTHYPKKEEVLIRLKFDEALVLWEFLSRFSDKDTLSIEHPAEKRILWDLECIIEKEVAMEASMMGYEETLNLARKTVGD